MTPTERVPDVKTVRIELPIATLLTLVAVLAGCWIFLQLSAVTMVLVGSLMIASALSPVLGWLENRKLGRTLSLTLVFGGCALLLGTIGFVTLPALWAEISRIVTDLPRMQSQLAQALESHRALSRLATPVRNFHLEQSGSSPGAVNAVANASMTVVEVVGYGASSVILAIYFMADRERMRGALYAVVPRRFHLRLARVLLSMGTIVGGYIRGQLITSGAIAVFTFILLTLLHVRSALALAAFAGLTDVIPFIGGLLATAPSVLVALSSGTVTALVVLASMIAYQEFESRVLVPLVYGKTLRLPSVAVVLSLLIGGKLAGILGAFLALPAAAGLLMLVEELRLDLPGVDTDDSAVRARDTKAEQVYAVQSSGASAEEAAKVAVVIADKIHQADVKRSDEAEPAPIPVTEGKTPREP